mgnify:FL=1
MKNIINYFYNLNITELTNKDNIYSFYDNDELYYFYIYNNNIKNINLTKDIDDSLKKDTLIHEIIINKDNSIITYYNNIPYILCKINININKPITLGEINYLSSKVIITNSKITYHSWQDLWSIKMDYLEKVINENGKKYPIIVDSFNYFVGMAENAISYYNNLSNKEVDNNSLAISHRIININATVYAIYDPVNIIIDHKARDIAEYIKYSFFSDNTNIFKELNVYFKYNYYTKDDVVMLLARVLYPSFYFNMYEDIMINSKEEKIITNITSKLDKYELYLTRVFKYFNNFYNLPVPEWLNK